MLYTSVVEPRHLTEEGEAITVTMHLFQERITRKHAIRRTIVDEQVFAAAIHAHSPAAELDWRADQEHLSHASIEVPSPSPIM